MNFKISTFKLVLVALAGIVLSSCSGFGGGGSNTPEFRLSNLQGLWLEDKDTTKIMHFVRFTTEKSDEAGYLYGREWDEKEDVYEKDLYRYKVDTVWNIDTVKHDTISYKLDSIVLPGNGWFKYQLETKGDLHEIHLMDNAGAEIPKEYIVAVLTDERLEYYEKDNKNRKTYFNKVVEKKK